MLKLLLKVCTIIFAIFILLEISLRIYQQFNPAFVPMPDDTYFRYRGSPNSPEINDFRLNSRGYKDVEYKIKKDKGVFRIIALGDSYVYGAVPYNSCYMTLLEEKIRRRDKKCELINMGICSAAPVDYLSLFINEGMELNPDMVLINITMSDDFKNGGKRFKLYSYSHAAAFINSIIANNVKHEGRIFATGNYNDNIPVRSEKSYIKYLIDTESMIFRKNNRKFNSDFNSSVSIIKKIKQLCDLKKIAFVAVICPTILQLDPIIQEKLSNALDAKPRDFDFKIPNRMLAEEFKKNKIIYIDLLDDFLKNFKKKKVRFYLQNDPHWNIAGNRLGAELVYPWIISEIKKNN